MGYLTPEEFGKKIRPAISGRRVRKLCSENRVAGAEYVGGRWIIPETAKIDDRDKRRKKD